MGRSSVKGFHFEDNLIGLPFPNKMRIPFMLRSLKKKFKINFQEIYNFMHAYIILEENVLKLLIKILLVNILV